MARTHVCASPKPALAPSDESLPSASPEDCIEICAQLKI